MMAGAAQELSAAADSRGCAPPALVPSIPALILVEPDESMTIVDVHTGNRVTARGVVARAIGELLATGHAPELLTTLHGTLGRLVAALQRHEAVPLGAAEAVRLDGFDTLFLELTGECNERCVHCYSESSPQLDTALTQPTCEAVLCDARALGFRRVQFTGGEPLQCTFLSELLERARDLGFPRREIYTNGLLLDAALLARLAPLEPSFALSFYSHDPSVHDGITRTPGSQQRTTAAIKRVVAAQLPLRVSIIVMEQNAGDQQRTVDFVRALGVDNVSLAPSRAVGRGRFFVEPSDNPPSKGGSTSRRCAGKLCVSSDGRVYPCIFNREDCLGRLDDRSLLDIARAPAATPRPDAGVADVMEACRARLQCRTCRLTALSLWAAARHTGD